MSDDWFLAGFDQVARCGEYDYSWTEGILWRHTANGVLLWGVTSGCSCYDYAENIEPEDLIHVDSWADAVDLAKDDFTEAEVADFVAQLMGLPGDCAPSQVVPTDAVDLASPLSDDPAQSRPETP